MMEDFNPFAEKLNIALSIQEIGPGKKIRLVFDDKGQFMISSGNDDIFPSGQGRLDSWKYETSLVLKKRDCGDWDWPKYAAEDMLCEIANQMKRNGLRSL